MTAAPEKPTTGNNPWLSALRFVAKTHKDAAHSRLVMAIWSYAEALMHGVPHLGEVGDDDLEHHWEELFVGDCSIQITSNSVTATLPDWVEFSCTCSANGGMGCDCSPPDRVINLLDRQDIRRIEIEYCPGFLSSLDILARQFVRLEQKEEHENTVPG